MNMKRTEMLAIQTIREKRENRQMAVERL